MYSRFPMTKYFKGEIYLVKLLCQRRCDAAGRQLETYGSQAAVMRALKNLDLAIAGKETIVTVQPLPAIVSDTDYRTQLFSNLICNELKLNNGRLWSLYPVFARKTQLCRFINDEGIDPEHCSR
jgi:light-regulated signal transduction histidine kinase (bacteriophytochrome)